MNNVDTIPESVTQWPEPPRLLVEWSSPWEEFKSALGPALARPPKRLAGEAPTGMFPYRGMLVCWLLECLLLIAIIVIPERFSSLQTLTPPTRPQWEVCRPSLLQLVPNGTSSITPATNCRKPKTRAARSPASPDAPAVSKPTTLRRPSALCAARNPARKLWTLPR